MPTLLELCSNETSRETIKKMQSELQREKEFQEIETKRKAETRHRETHIFDSYEDALDFLVENEHSVISWHVNTLSYQPDKNMFLSYEQEYPSDGAVPFYVKRYYSRTQLLEKIENHIKENGYTLDDFKDKYGKLEYVHIIKR